MSGTSGSIGNNGGVLVLPPPKLRLRTIAGGAAVPLTLFAGGSAESRHSISVVLSGVPSEAFVAKHAAELRLYRYARSKSASSQQPAPGRWAALPHVEGGVNPYAGSNWLGGMPASGGTDRFSRVVLAGLGSNDTVDVLDLARHWLINAACIARDSALSQVQTTLVRASWRAHTSYVSPSWGVSRNVEPARFGIGFVARDSKGRWYAASAVSTFTISNHMAPFVWNAAHPDNVPPSPGSAGRRVYVVSPGYKEKLIMGRITRSELIPGSP